MLPIILDMLIRSYALHKEATNFLLDRARSRVKQQMMPGTTQRATLTLTLLVCENYLRSVKKKKKKKLKLTLLFNFKIMLKRNGQ